MLKSVIFFMLTTSVMLLSACGGGSTPIPFLVDQKLDVLDECVTDFSSESGDCLRIEDGVVSDTCAKVEDKCVEHFYIDKSRGLPHFTHINAKYPCYPEWLIDRYTDPDSIWYQHGDYRVISIKMSSLMVDDVLQLIEILEREELQSSQMCYYRLEVSVEDLTNGEYQFKLWNPDQELILQHIFNK